MIDSTTQRAMSPRPHQRRGRGGPGRARRRMLAFALVLGLTLTLMPTTALADHHVTSSDSGYGGTRFTTYTGTSCRDDGTHTVPSQESPFTNSSGEQQRIARFHGNTNDTEDTTVRAPGYNVLQICANAAATNCWQMRGWAGKGRLTRNFFLTMGWPVESVVYDLTDISWEPAVGTAYATAVFHMTGRYRATSYGPTGSGPAQPWGDGTVLMDFVMGAPANLLLGGWSEGNLGSCPSRTYTLQSLQLLEDPDSSLPG